jgi:hypothetical protein
MDGLRRAKDCDGQRQLARGGHQVPQGGGRGLLHHAQQGTQSNHQTLELSKNTPRFDVYFPSGVIGGTGSGIRCTFDPWIRGFGMGKKSGSGSGMNNLDHISESLKINLLD